MIHSTIGQEVYFPFVRVVFFFVARFAVVAVLRLVPLVAVEAAVRFVLFLAVVRLVPFVAAVFLVLRLAVLPLVLFFVVFALVLLVALAFVVAVLRLVLLAALVFVGAALRLVLVFFVLFLATPAADFFVVFFFAIRMAPCSGVNLSLTTTFPKHPTSGSCSYDGPRWVVIMGARVIEQGFQRAAPTNVVGASSLRIAQVRELNQLCPFFVKSNDATFDKLYSFSKLACK